MPTDKFFSPRGEKKSCHRHHSQNYHLNTARQKVSGLRRCNSRHCVPCPSRGTDCRKFVDCDANAPCATSTSLRCSRVSVSSALRALRTALKRCDGIVRHARASSSTSAEMCIVQSDICKHNIHVLFMGGGATNLK